MSLPKLRRQQYPGHPQLTELAGDVQQALDAIVPMSLLPMTDVYAEPMTLKLARIPKAVLAIDVREDASPDESIVAWAPVNFTAINGGVRINSIEGPLTGTKYRYVFLLIG